MRRPPARVIVLNAIAQGLTSKEAVFEFGYTLRSLQEAARRMKVSFPYSGYGRPPQFKTKLCVKHHKQDTI
jgi:hypothetical protein